MLFMVNEKGILRYLLKIYKNFDRKTTRYAFFNIEQVSDYYKTLTMKSGAEIPMSRTGKKEFFKSLSLSRDTETFHLSPLITFSIIFDEYTLKPLANTLHYLPAHSNTFSEINDLSYRIFYYATQYISL